MALSESKHYYVEVTKDPEHDELKCYGITNKETEVTEYYDNLLPRAYEAMCNMEEKYVEMLEHIEGKETTLKLVMPEITDIIN